MCVGLTATGGAQTATPNAAGKPAIAPQVRQAEAQLRDELLSVKRIYVGKLSGGAKAEALRDLIISSLNATKLFVLTDNPDHADAVLKGAADDHAFEDTLDINDGISGRLNGGHGTGSLFSSTGSYGSSSISDRESRRIRERKHEAYAAVRLCGRDGDVLWTATEESDGGKFRGASADVAAKVARDLTFALERARRAAGTEAAK